MSSSADGLEKDQFTSVHSYRDFAEQVRNDRRYVWSDNVQRFLDTVLSTRHSRDTVILADTILWRAQLGIKEVAKVDSDGNEIGIQILGHPANRMKPLPDGAIEGRVNPPGIPVLYLSSCAKTAVSEVKPWTGSGVSVAQFRILRDLKAIDLSQGYGESEWKGLTWSNLLGKIEPSPDVIEKVTWTRIDKAFSIPITSSENTTEYVPTQILAELFAGSGYEAIIYHSHFVEDGYNIAVFDIEYAAIENCSPYEVKKVTIEFDQVDNTWYMDDEGTMVYNSIISFESIG